MKGRFKALLKVGILLCFFGLAVHSMVQKSPTFDEQGFIVRGLAYLRNTNRSIRVGHPLGLNALNASLLYFDEEVVLPSSELGTDFHISAEALLWNLDNNVEKIMILARTPTLYLGMLLICISGRWLKELTRSTSLAILGMTIIAFDPNIMAHSRLATTDLGLLFGVTVASYTLWRWLNQPTLLNVTLFSIGFAILQNTKFTAGLFVPIFGLIIAISLIHFWRSNNLIKPLAQITLLFPLISLTALWAMYGFAIGTLPNTLPSLSFLAGRTIPLAPHIEQLADIGGRMQLSTPAFLLGQYSDSGWWYYFPIAFLLKTPTATIILILCGTTLWIKLGRWLDWLIPLISALSFLAFSMTTDINIGYRHILPVTLLLIICGIAGLNQLKPISPLLLTLIATLIATLSLATNLWIAPHYLTYFNLPAGGANNGWRLLSDSNIDWGQDLAALKLWMDDNHIDQIRLSYFGEARPDYYGINYIGLPSIPPRLMHPDRVIHYPHDPAPGTYAISATNLQGVLFQNHQLFAFFQNRKPRAKIGNSIFIYDIEPHYTNSSLSHNKNQPKELMLGNIQLDEIPPDLFNSFGTNDIKVSWFDPEQSLIFRPDWNHSAQSIITKDGVGLPPPFYSFSELNSFRSIEGVTAYQYTFGAFNDKNPNWNKFDKAIRFTPQNDNISLSLLGADFHTTHDSHLEIETFWQATYPPPFKLFFHITRANQFSPLTQWDGLSVDTHGWRDHTVVQLSKIDLSALPTGEYQIWAGVYSPDTEARWLTDQGERILIGEFNR